VSQLNVSNPANNGLIYAKNAPIPLMIAQAMHFNEHSFLCRIPLPVSIGKAVTSGSVSGFG
jgi:hypothetical protein